MCGVQAKEQKPAIIFDFGGVLGTTDKTYVQNFIQHALGVSAQEAKSLIDGLHDAKAQGITPDQFWADYANKRGVPLPVDWVNRLEVARAEAITPDADAINYVESLRKKGYRVGLLSNVTELRAMYIKSLGVYALFDPLILSYQVGFSKPDPQIYKLLLAQLNLPPKLCIVIDNKKVNIDVAESLGMKGIVFTSLKQLKKDLNALLKKMQHNKHHKSDKKSVAECLG
jgi:putative hydrolase of the HAD superfamily